MSDHRGGCHCRNLRLSLRLSQPPADMRIRACGCSFCRAHNTRTVSDPNGAVEIRADDWALVERYRFGTATAEFLICRRCGVYIGAIGEVGPRVFAVINTNCLDDRGAFMQAAAAVDHDGEATQDRLMRRAANWTPATIHP